MFRFLAFLCLTVATSCYIFPFEFKALPGLNTKMFMAGWGLVVLLYKLAKEGKSVFDKQVFKISVIAFLISLTGFASITYNNTTDTAYSTYIVSMWVWLGGAYMLAFLIKRLHGYVSIPILGNYLIAACFMQCILALMIDRIPSFYYFVNSYVGNFGVGGSVEGFRDSGRLFGIGAAVDFAGARFVPVLVIIAVLVITYDGDNFKRFVPLYLFVFFFITFIGNMMSRTTIIGTILAFVYWIFITCMSKRRLLENVIFLWKNVVLLLLILLPIIIYLYYTNDFIYGKVRFGFEGFFSLAEKGYWETNSNNILENMYRFPTSLKIWIIGDGYFDNPTSDPYYIGYMWRGFYMGTDVGYLRFIFYFGLIGLLFMIAFVFSVTSVLIEKCSRYKALFILLAFVNFVIWFKVSTDIFPIFALLLMVDASQSVKCDDAIVD